MTRSGLPTLAACLSVGIVATAARVGVAEAFEGRYAAGDAAYEQGLAVTRSGDGFRAKVSVATRGCVGEVEAMGRASGAKLVLRPNGREGRECRITAKRSGSTLVVSEDHCLFFHGSACEFSGTYRPVAR